MQGGQDLDAAAEPERVAQGSSLYEPSCTGAEVSQGDVLLGFLGGEVGESAIHDAEERRQLELPVGVLERRRFVGLHVAPVSVLARDTIAAGIGLEFGFCCRFDHRNLTFPHRREERSSQCRRNCQGRSAELSEVGKLVGVLCGTELRRGRIE